MYPEIRVVFCQFFLVKKSQFGLVIEKFEILGNLSLLSYFCTVKSER